MTRVKIPVMAAGLCALLSASGVSAQSTPATPGTGAQPAGTGTFPVAEPAPAPAAPTSTAPSAAPAAPPPPTFPSAAPAAPPAPPAAITLTPPASTEAGDRRGHQALAAFAEQERSARFAGGFGLLISGASLVVTGLVMEEQFNEDFGKPLWISGIVVGAVSVFPFLLKGPFETLARDTAAKSPTELRLKWAEDARSARSARRVGGGVSLGLGAASLGTGAAVAAGAGDFDDDAQEAWTLGLLLLGGAFLAGGTTAFLVESPLESGYRAAYGSSYDDVSSLEVNVGVGAAPSGATFALHGTF